MHGNRLSRGTCESTAEKGLETTFPSAGKTVVLVGPGTVQGPRETSLPTPQGDDLGTSNVNIKSKVPGPSAVA